MGVEIRQKPGGELIRAAAKVAAPLSTSLEIAVCHESKPRGNCEHIIGLYDDLRPTLQTYLSARGLSKEHSEDVIQEAFLRLMRHIVKRPDENPRAWIFRVAHNLSMDHHRLERRQFHENERDARPVLRERVDPAPDPEQQIILSEHIRRFREAFAELTPKQQHCLLLRARGLRYREIALHMGVSVQRIGELMQRAISLIEAGVVRR